MTRARLGSLERAVLAVVGGSPDPLTVAEVQRELPESPAYTTVMTTLARLATKGARRQLKDGRAYRYGLAAPVETVGDAVTARRMHRLLSDGSNRAGVLARFVAELDADEEQLLLDLLDKPEH
jgi:predicted transcriptional regulator